jgi:hypothetical protein
MTQAQTMLPCPFCGCAEIELWTGFGTQADILHERMRGGEKLENVVKGILDLLADELPNGDSR